jgi:hypothetical protein
VRFPPHKKVADLKSISSFNLRKEGVQVQVMEWVGDLDQFSELKEACITVEGIPPKWCDCKVFSQMALGFRLLLDVDWASLFKSFYEKVRLRVTCRNPKKIPLDRLFEMDKKLYLISIQVEGYEQEEASKADMDDDDGLDDFGIDDQQEDDKDDQHQMDIEGNGGSVGDLVGQGGNTVGVGSKTVVDRSISEAVKEQTENRVGDKSQESEVNVDNLDLQSPTSIAHL